MCCNYTLLVVKLSDFLSLRCVVLMNSAHSNNHSHLAKMMLHINFDFYTFVNVLRAAYLMRTLYIKIYIPIPILWINSECLCLNYFDSAPKPWT